MRGDERGSVAVLVLGLALVCFAVAGLALDGTKVFLMRRALQNSADAAALSGANQIDVGSYYRSGGAVVRLQPEVAERIAARSIAERGLPVSAGLLVHEGAVQVELRGEVPTTFLKLVGIRSIEVAARGTAEPFPQEVPIGR